MPRRVWSGAGWGVVHSLRGGCVDVLGVMRTTVRTLVWPVEFTASATAAAALLSGSSTMVSTSSLPESKSNVSR